LNRRRIMITMMMRMGQGPNLHSNTRRSQALRSLSWTDSLRNHHMARVKERARTRASLRSTVRASTAVGKVVEVIWMTTQTIRKTSQLMTLQIFPVRTK
jgi:hypothetical protein